MLEDAGERRRRSVDQWLGTDRTLGGEGLAGQADGVAARAGQQVGRQHHVAHPAGERIDQFVDNFQRFISTYVLKYKHLLK